MVTVINGDGLILGRLASITAQRALAGEEIAIVNVEQIIISGSRARVLGIYYHKRDAVPPVIAGDPCPGAGRTIS